MHTFVNRDKRGVGEGEMGDGIGVLSSKVQK